MRPGAHVKSVEAIEAFRAALCLFGEEAEQSLASIQAEIDDFVEWLEVEQIKFWRAEVRRREQLVADAKADLHRCLSATVDAHHTPSCYQEKKVLDAAKKRLHEAEDKLALVRRWIPVVRQAAMEYRMKVEPLRSSLSGDLPAAAGYLANSVDRLHEYLSLEPPSGTFPANGPAEQSADTVSPPVTAPVIPNESGTARRDNAATKTPEAADAAADEKTP
ncbi:MAG: hypothetical protein ABUL64_03055 [Singulisphaera sp.]